MMRLRWLVGAASLCAGCSLGQLERTPEQTAAYTAVGRVVAVQPIALEGDESLAARITTGSLAGGLVGGVATAVTEPGFTRSAAWTYHIRREDGEFISLVSRSVIENGECVSVLQYQSDKLPVLRAEPAESCSEPR